jgi:putative endonuclease
MAVVYVYILQCADGTYYAGWTADLARRLATHNAGRGSRYTRLRRPVEMVYWEEQPDRGSAQRREQQIKRLSHARKQALAEGFGACRDSDAGADQTGGRDDLVVTDHSFGDRCDASTATSAPAAARTGKPAETP